MSCWKRLEAGHVYAEGSLVDIWQYDGEYLMSRLGYCEEWKHLLSTNRVSFPLDANGKQIKDGTKLEMRLGQIEEFRTQFETDYCRIIFSSPFRRLAGKTQVHPFSEIDYVHNRLTHSLKVSSVAYSLSRSANTCLNSPLTSNP